MPRPSCGSLLAPKMMMTMARMTSISGNPSRPMLKLLRHIVPPVPRLRRILAVLAMAAGIAVFPYASGVSRAAGQFASRVSLVEVYATVTGPDGRAIEGLRALDFVVEEDGVPQRIDAFASEGFALAVAVGLDRSFSM